MFVKIATWPSVSEKYLQIGPKPSKNPKKISKFRKGPYLLRQNSPTTSKIPEDYFAPGSFQSHIF
jgi:hypothetical protein